MFKVLIADDEKKVIQLMQKLIDWEGAGYEIVGTANDGLTALELVERLQPDLLVTDIRMPGCSGIELLRQARDLKSDLLCIVVSGYREFEYAQSALKYGVEDYLLKPLNKNEMTELLHKIRAKLTKGIEQEYQKKLNARRNQELLIRKLRDSSASGSGFTDRERVNQEYGFCFLSGISAVMLVKPDIPKAVKHRQSYGILMEHTLETVRKFAPVVAEEWAAAILPEGVAVLLNSGEAEFPDLKKYFLKIRKEIEQERDLFGEIRVTICLGLLAESFAELPRSLETAVQLCEDRLCIKETIRNANTETFSSLVRCQLESGERIALQEAVELLAADEYVLELESSFLKMNYNKKISGRMIRNWFEDVVDLTLFKLSSFGVEGNRIKADLLDQFWYASTAMEVKDILKEGFCYILEELHKEKEAKEAKPITDAKRYIREHYRETLRLEDVSSAVGFNATYFSSLFKKETGMNYMDYLTELRMTKAKELLSESDLSLADVAEQVGYNDLKYFSRLFKKAAGINPSEYKKLYS